MARWVSSLTYQGPHQDTTLTVLAYFGCANVLRNDIPYPDRYCSTQPPFAVINLGFPLTIYASARAPKAACQEVRLRMQVVAHKQGLLPHNALELVSAYDVVLDASDNAPTRYLASDACCVAGKPLISGAALGMDGQLTALCVQPNGVQLPSGCRLRQSWLCIESGHGRSTKDRQCPTSCTSKILLS